MSTSDQLILAADLCHTVAQRFEREGKSNGGPSDVEGRVCVVLALEAENTTVEIITLVYDAIEAAAELPDWYAIPDWSDSSPTQVVIDCLRVAEKALLRKADADV